MFNVIMQAKNTGQVVEHYLSSQTVNKIHCTGVFVIISLPAQPSPLSLFMIGSLLQWLRFKHCKILTAKDKIESYILNLIISFIAPKQRTRF
jgi:hypothetical protein